MNHTGGGWKGEMAITYGKLGISADKGPMGIGLAFQDMSAAISGVPPGYDWDAPSTWRTYHSTWDLSTKTATYPIRIGGDTEFDEDHGVVSGSGTAGDPYIIANWTIDGDGDYACLAINLRNEDDSDSAGMITLLLKEEGKRAYLSISDNGIGLTKDQQDALFLPFFSAWPGSIQESARSGLGLWIARSIIEGFEGTIRYENDTDRGCICYIEFPVSL